MERVYLSSAPNWSHSCLDGLTKSLCWKNKVLSHSLLFSHFYSSWSEKHTVFALPDPQSWYKNYFLVNCGFCQIVRVLLSSSFFHPDSFGCWCLRHETALSASA